MATHPSILAWSQSVVSHRVGHDWNNLSPRTHVSVLLLLELQYQFIVTPLLNEFFNVPVSLLMRRADILCDLNWSYVFADNLKPGSSVPSATLTTSNFVLFWFCYIFGTWLSLKFFLFYFNLVRSLIRHHPQNMNFSTTCIINSFFTITAKYFF